MEQLIVESLTFTVNGDIINHHVAPFVGNVHDEILTFCMPGTIFHHKHIPVSLSLFRGFFSTFCEFTGLVQYLLYPNMKVRASKSSSLLQDKSEQLLWSYRQLWAA